MRAKEFIKENVVDFPTDPQYAHYLKSLSDEEKYNQALADQNPKHRPNVGHESCPYCGDVDCDYDCDESQADGYNNPKYDHKVAQDMETHGENESYSDEMVLRLLKNAGLYNNDSDTEMDEGSKENAAALVGSGRADPHGKKTNPDSSAHKKVRTPTTTYSKDRKKYNNGAAPGANDGFVGG